MQIEDGTGQGFFARVSSKFRLAVESLSRSLLSVAAEDGDAFGVTTTFLPITATQGKILWIENTSKSKHLHMSKIWFNWNGGDTNHNRSAEGVMYIGGTVPTVGTAQGGAGNLNTGSSKTFDLDVKQWDGSTGTGMTGGTAGQGAFYFLLTQGPSVYLLDSALILAPGDAYSFDIKGEEAGSVSINMIGLMEEHS